MMNFSNVPLESLDVKVSKGSLVLMSGLPSSGKSYILRNMLRTNPMGGEDELNASMVVSMNDLRIKLFGELYSHQGYLIPSDLNDDLVLNLMEDVVHTRLSNGLSTFVDAYLLNDEDRSRFVDIGINLGVPVLILIMEIGVEEAIRRNNNRRHKLPEDYIRYMGSLMQWNSVYPYLCAPSFEISIDIPEIPDEISLDLIPYVGGMYKELITLMNELGYEGNDGYITHHDKNRRLLFMGDISGKGYDSINAIKLVMNCVKSGHYALISSHDNKLLQGLKFVNQGMDGHLQSSRLINELISDIIHGLSDSEVKSIISFFNSLPTFYVRKSDIPCAYIHKHNGWFDPHLTPSRDILTPSNEYITYEFDRNISDYELITSDLIRSKVNHMEDPYTLISYRESDDLINEVSFNDYQYESRITLLDYINRCKSLIGIEGDKGMVLFARRNIEINEGLDNINESMVLDFNGCVINVLGDEYIQRPIHRIPYYGDEHRSYIDPNMRVEAVIKISGYGLSMTINPYKDELLITSSQSFDDNYIRWGRDLLGPHKESLILDWCRKNPNITLMFQVVHPLCRHESVVNYEKEEEGLYLICARYKDSGLYYTETQLDELSVILGNVYRPNHYRVQMSRLLYRAKASNNVEGYIIRDTDKYETYLCKVKTSWYIANKFISRDEDVNVLFHNPEEYKRTCKEEFIPLIDQLSKLVSFDEYMSMNDDKKIEIIKGVLF